MYIMGHSACLFINPITVIAMISSLHDGGSGLRLNDSPNVELLFLGCCMILVLWLGPQWLNLRVTSALTICESFSFYSISSLCVNLIMDCFSVNIHCIM